MRFGMAKRWFCAVALSYAAYSLPMVSDIVAQQRWPWNGLKVNSHGCSKIISIK